MKHYSDCAFAHPWPRHRVDHVQTRGGGGCDVIWRTCWAGGRAL
jgi:hypothetical protein